MRRGEVFAINDLPRLNRHMAQGPDSIWYTLDDPARHLAVNIGVHAPSADSGAIRSMRVPAVNGPPSFVAF